MDPYDHLPSPDYRPYDHLPLDEGPGIARWPVRAIAFAASMLLAVFGPIVVLQPRDAHLAASAPRPAMNASVSAPPANAAATVPAGMRAAQPGFRRRGA